MNEHKPVDPKDDEISEGSEDDAGDADDDEDYVTEEDEEDDPYPSSYVTRTAEPTLPGTVTKLTLPDGSKVFLVGTAHFSESSQNDVAQTIQATQPDTVMVELCSSRVNILALDEATLLEEAKNISMEKLRNAVQESGVVQGVMHILLLSMSAHITKQLGMAPGGEFRAALREARRIPGCRLSLGNRPIQITLRRALGSLSLWQKLRLAFHIIISKDPISAEDVEKCKEKDLLEEMLREMTGEFPALSRVFVTERDMFLAHSLKQVAQPVPAPNSPTGFVPSVVVGVVGIGHVPGIVKNWNTTCDIAEVMTIPPPSTSSKVFRWSVRVGFVVAVSWTCLRVFPGIRALIRPF